MAVKPTGPYTFDPNHPMMNGCTVYCPFIDWERKNLITDVDVVDTGILLEQTKDGNAVLYSDRRGTYTTSDVTNSTSCSVVGKFWPINAGSGHIAFFGTVNTDSGVTGFEYVMQNSDKQIWWAHELNFAVNLTGDFLVPDVMYDLGFIYDETTGLRLFADSTLADTDSTTGAFSPASNLQILGRGDTNTSYTGYCGVEYVMMFDRAITDQEYLDIIADPYAPLRGEPVVTPKQNAIFHGTDF